MPTALWRKEVRLSRTYAKGATALIVLRGFPGYQCPLCNRQVNDLIKNAQAIRDAGLRVLMVYPGPAEDLGGKANEFLTGKTLPDGFELVLDPDYAFTNMY